ncbi:hypothetical protein J2Z50_002822 [Ensifer mexicanus]|nr:hypothetical protein [Sinorhizobium mexicanum]
MPVTMYSNLGGLTAIPGVLTPRALPASVPLAFLSIVPRSVLAEGGCTAIAVCLYCGRPKHYAVPFDVRDARAIDMQIMISRLV